MKKSSVRWIESLNSLLDEASLRSRKLRRIKPAAAGGAPLSLAEIAAEETFAAWCERLGAAGLRVDGHPFSLATRPAMWEVYAQIPVSIEAAFGRTLVLQKGAQVGATIFEQLVALYFALKFHPCKCLLYLPDRSMAAHKSAQRFLPILRSIPDLLRQITQDTRLSEGSVLTRVFPRLGSSFLFLWTRAREGGVTESFPGDFLSLDEVQGVTLEQVDRVTERLSASRIRYRLLLSTPLWPELDINAFYLQGDQRRFHSDCACADGVVLTDQFMDVALRGRGDLPVAVRDGEWVYRCPVCQGWVDDPQVGRWVAHHPGAPYPSFHLSQVLSPTVSPREVVEAWGLADSVARRQTFFCRKLGAPFADDSQTLATLPVLRECALAGQMAGVTWQSGSTDSVMGVDQMGSFAVVTIAARWSDGRMAIIHVELVYALDPWARLDVLISQYGVRVCVVEQLPSIDSARLFAHRHPGVCWLITSYGDLEEFVVWGDVAVSKSDRKTQADYTDRWTLRADRYRVLDWAAARLRERFILFADPGGLLAEMRDGARGPRQGSVLPEVFWLHYCKTGLILREPDQDPTDKSVRPVRREVLKLGLDPHASFSLMACCLAWFRAHGTSHFILPEPAAGPGVRMVGLPPSVAGLLETVAQPRSGCGRCVSFVDGACVERGVTVRPDMPACEWFCAP